MRYIVAAMRRFVMAIVLLLAACAGGSSESTSETSQDIVTTTQPEGGNPFRALAPLFGADGNQVAHLSGPFDESPTMERYREARVVRVDLPSDDVVAITYDDGEVRLMGPDEMKVRLASASTGLIYTDGPRGIDILQPLPDQAPHSRPAVLANGQVAYVTGAGDLVVWDEGEIARTSIDALPDSDVLTDDQGRLLVLTGPTDRYPHAILGDELEATGFAIVEPPGLTMVSSGQVDEADAIEARRALWVDVDGDGIREVQVTLSNSREGARLVLFDESGQVRAEGAPIGRGNRWRHQIAFGQFGEQNLGVEVLTPHIGGIVSFHTYGDEITRVARRSDFTSHAIGSRELDGAVAIDIDGDDRLELVIPTQDRRTLVAIGLVDGEARVVWRVDLGGRLSSNIAVGKRGGVATIAVGTANGTIHFWSASP